MSSLLGTMDTLPPAVMAKSRKRKQSPEYDDEDYSSPLRPDFRKARRKPSYGDMSSDGPMDDFPVPSSDDLFLSPKKKMKVNDGVVTPAIDRLAHLDVHSNSSDFDVALDASFDDFDMDAFMDIDDVDVKPPLKVDQPGKPKPGLTKKEEPEAKPSWLSVYDSLTTVDEDALGPLASTSAATTTNISALEPDGSIRFYWIDYLELDGKIYFIGKLKDKVTAAWISCCITVEGLERNLFVLPNKNTMEQTDDGEIVETDIIPSQDDVYQDFDRIRKQLKIKSWRAKFVKRKYAFGEEDVPTGESNWLKVVYGFNGITLEVIWYFLFSIKKNRTSGAFWGLES